MKVCENFEKDVLHGNGYILVDFYADWCGPCRRLTPVVEEISCEIEGVTFFKFNVDSDEAVPTKYRVNSVPNLILFKDGNVVASKVGSDSKVNLKAWIQDNTK